MDCRLADFHSRFTTANRGDSYWWWIGCAVRDGEKPGSVLARISPVLAHIDEIQMGNPDH